MIYYNEQANTPFIKRHKDVFRHCLEIAKDTTNPDMCKRDVNYALRRNGHFFPSKVYADVEQDSYLVAILNQDFIRIYGLATRKTATGKGGGYRLLSTLVRFARYKGISKLRILTKTGADFFFKRGFIPVSVKGDEYYMEYYIKQV